VLAAAGLYALKHHVERLAEDHDNARALAEGLSGIEGLGVDPATVQTNMVFVTLPAERAEALRTFLRARNILLGTGNPARLVTHLDVSLADVHALVQAVQEFFASADRPQPVLLPG